MARAVADRWLGAGLPQVAGAYTAALMALYNDKEPRARAPRRDGDGVRLPRAALGARRASAARPSAIT